MASTRGSLALTEIERRAPLLRSRRHLDTIPGVEWWRPRRLSPNRNGHEGLSYRPPIRLGRVAPGNHESAGKRFPRRARQGNRPVKGARRSRARAIRVKDTYLSAQYHRLAGRGRKRAMVAVALRSCFRLPPDRRDEDYKSWGQLLRRAPPRKTVRHLISRLSNRLRRTLNPKTVEQVA